jgi:RNA polymerase sigma-70 factor (ECF subfamily)
LVPALDNVLMPTSTVAELVNEARRGSAEARDELVRRHHREAAILAATMVNDPTEAEDISQEAFTRAFRNLDLLVDPSRFVAWLRRIVNGVSIDWLRSFRPDLYRGWTDADEMVNASRDRSPLDHLLHSEMVRRVGAALEALPPRPFHSCRPPVAGYPETSTRSEARPADRPSSRAWREPTRR